MSSRKPGGAAADAATLLGPKIRFQPQSRWSIPYSGVPLAAMLLDFSLLVLAEVASSSLYHWLYFGDWARALPQALGFSATLAVIFIAVSNSRDLYEPPALLNLKRQIREIPLHWCITLLFLTAVAFTVKVSQDFSRGATISGAVLGLCVLLAMRVCWRIFLGRGLAARRFAGRQIAVIAQQVEGASEYVPGLLQLHALQPSRLFELPPANDDTCRIAVRRAIAAIRGSEIQEIVVSATLENWANLKEILAELRVLPLPVSLVPVGPLADVFQLSSSKIGDTVTLELQRGPRTVFERALKRTLDVAFAATGCIILAPLFVLVATIVKLDSPGPVLFRQRRCGFNRREFQIFKFRTMTVLEDADTIVQAQRNDKRITRVGAWLRRTSIDELPQLLNVLRGEMSLVGPRPHAVAHDNEFDGLVKAYAYRQHVKPGLTGWAQVNGYRGETRTVADIEKRVQFDLWYIDNWSLGLDFRIILMTVIGLINGKNAY